MNIPTMRQLYNEFMHSAFGEGKRIGLLKDGHYHVPTDVDCIGMFCMGNEL